MSAGNSASAGEHIPLLCKGGGGCGINKKSRSHRSAADRGRSPRKPDRAQPSTEAVAHTQMFQNAFRNVTCERPPRPRLFGTGPFFDGAATPPLQGGEYARLNSGLVSIFLLQVTSEKCPNVSERPFPSLHHR